ncbi:uncharacterized protein LOC126979255 [Leptidea sinapis]|uniref:uncharacterized protein LOC126979255 n=1 Tax=Leptidea sinapis TaxID=189913 RepID=UPI002145F08A|nr:uncharacterized protein LOC126979255 [Leptidea sinapis]
MTTKKSVKSKFVADDISDFLNESHFMKESPTAKKPIKRNKTVCAENSAEKIYSKKRSLQETETNGEARQKLLNTMNRQMESRNELCENLHKNLSEVIAQHEADYNAMKENEQKFEHITNSFMKCMQQATAAHKQKLKAFKEIHAAFKKQYEDLDGVHKMEISKLGDEIHEDIENLKQKLITETRRNGWESMRRSLFQAMQNDNMI